MKETAKKFKVEMTVYIPANNIEDEEDILSIVVSSLDKERYVYDCEVTEIKEEYSVHPEVSE